MFFNFSFNLTDNEFIKTPDAIGALTGFILTICVLYGILFCFGISGNLWVVSVVVYILRSFRNLTQNQNVFLYILSLSIVDGLVLLNLPMLISDIYHVSWIFSGPLCKMYWIIESINKITSKFILTAMSFDRFLAICRPTCYHFVRSVSGTVIMLSLISGLVIVSLYPVYAHAEIVYFDEIFYKRNETIVVPRSKCILHMTDGMLLSFTVYLFGIGYCVPSILITCFYCRILCHVYSHKTSTVATSHIPVRRVTCGIFLLIIMYFVCWTPFWVTIMHTAFRPAYEPNMEEIYVMYLVHFLVYVNSAVNWILYAFLNKNLKETRIMAIKRNAESKTRLELNETIPLNKLTTVNETKDLMANQ